MVAADRTAPNQHASPMVGAKLPAATVAMAPPCTGENIGATALIFGGSRGSK